MMSVQLEDLRELFNGAVFNNYNETFKIYLFDTKLFIMLLNRLNKIDKSLISSFKLDINDFDTINPIIVDVNYPDKRISLQIKLLKQTMVLDSYVVTLTVKIMDDIPVFSGYSVNITIDDFLTILKRKDSCI